MTDSTSLPPCKSFDSLVNARLLLPDKFTEASGDYAVVLKEHRVGDSVLVAVTASVTYARGKTSAPTEVWFDATKCNRVSLNGYDFLDARALSQVPAPRLHSNSTLWHVTVRERGTQKGETLTVSAGSSEKTARAAAVSKWSNARGVPVSLFYKSMHIVKVTHD